MGCGASTESLKRDLESSRHEVEQLQQKLKESESRREDIERQMKKASSASAPEAEVSVAKPKTEAEESPRKDSCDEGKQAGASSSPVGPDKAAELPKQMPPEESVVPAGLPPELAPGEASAAPPPGLAEPASGESCQDPPAPALADGAHGVVEEKEKEKGEVKTAGAMEGSKDEVSPPSGTLKDEVKDKEDAVDQPKAEAVQQENLDPKAELPGIVVNEESEEAPCCETLSKSVCEENANEAPSSEDMRPESHEGDEDKLEKGKTQAKSLESTGTTCTPNAQTEKTVSTCAQCFCETEVLYLDPSDLNRYCESCWIEYYGRPPSSGETHPLVPVEVSEIWLEDLLQRAWAEQILPGWPPPLVQSKYSLKQEEQEQWSTVQVRVRRDICGPHAREQINSDRPFSGEILGQRYRISHMVGEGHFTKAFLAEDIKEGTSVCVKRHRQLSVEGLGDLFVLGRRLQEADPDGKLFPRLVGAFYDVVGYTVECLLEGQNCLNKTEGRRDFFQDLSNLRTVAVGALEGLVKLDEAGVVHNDIKPDNLIWIEGDGSSSSSSGPRVKIVDFGCARLDHREENGRNWALAEGGAGHLGKWAPEMILRLPIGHRGDVWGVAISLCELFCQRQMWRNEGDSAEVVFSQALGICNLRDGIPASLLRRSPLDVRQLYTPAPRHWPLRKNARGQVEALRPTRWGLDQVLRPGWQDTEKVELGQLLLAALVIDPAFRPSAAQLLQCCSFVMPQNPEEADTEGVTGE
eukprot:TRINITY_DN5757_c0_g1_i1.p1 TRINITY_DN5757_c0_g1~~TRINITY_DN5757_c0_g1_i1.p1  ORF type:complete len:750 (-),score=172.32 TRINITY_DN5757_c0_g1_i1:87-2336(-)